jgi:hypothetical protein
MKPSLPPKLVGKLVSAYNNAQGLRLIIVVVQVGAVTIYVASSGGAQEEKRKTG